MIVLGIDPGFASFGWSLVHLDSDSEFLLELGVIRTKKSTKKQNVYATDDNVRRHNEIHDALVEVITKVTEAGGEVACIATEAQSWPRNAGAAIKVALAWGAFLSIARDRQIPIVQVFPQDLKDKLTGDKKASKEAVKAAVQARPGMGTLAKHLSKINAKGQHEHPVDATAAVIACLDAPVIQYGRKA